MSDRATVKAQSLTYGASGTSTLVLSSATNTSNIVPLPRDDYTIQVDCLTTGTSIASASVVWQTSNDNLGWVPQGSATALSTNASTASSVNAASLSITAKYAYGRGVVASTGTGWAQVSMGS